MFYKNIIKDMLSVDERKEHEFSIGIGYIKFGFIIFNTISVILIFLNYKLSILSFAFTIFYFLFYLKISNIYVFTNKRILIHKGWLSTNMISVEYDKITDVRVQENFIYKILTKTGNLLINTASTSDTEIILLHVENPYNLKKILDSLIHNKKQ
ncbi:MAG: PH domain-containing protein [Patescibacteria group bacterium]|nr:PH domain-containing protein [Patescibacteria group bacterium]MDD4304081.1 PH domain-containing protein [Patescibacteria group bacterium]MDD4694958.1 PH domain-containing protein [Patescibacteria group bacterium]